MMVYIYKGRGLVIIYRSNRLLHLAPAKTLGWPERKREREREREREYGKPPRAAQTPNMTDFPSNHQTQGAARKPRTREGNPGTGKTKA